MSHPCRIHSWQTLQRPLSVHNIKALDGCRSWFCQRHPFCRTVQTCSALQESHLDADDPRANYMLQAGARLCKCLGNEFIPYLGVVMPSLLRSAQLKPDVNVADAGSDDEDDDDDDEVRPASKLHVVALIALAAGAFLLVPLTIHCTRPFCFFDFTQGCRAAQASHNPFAHHVMPMSVLSQS